MLFVIYTLTVFFAVLDSSNRQSILNNPLAQVSVYDIFPVSTFFILLNEHTVLPH